MIDRKLDSLQQRQVDDRGRVPASITIVPADPTVKMPDGTMGYPEPVLT